MYDRICEPDDHCTIDTLHLFLVTTVSVCMYAFGPCHSFHFDLCYFMFHFQSNITIITLFTLQRKSNLGSKMEGTPRSGG